VGVLRIQLSCEEKKFSWSVYFTHVLTQRESFHFKSFIFMYNLQHDEMQVSRIGYYVLKLVDGWK
jgi:hypothetical protein